MFLKYAKYSLTRKIFLNIQKKLFPVNSVKNESPAFFTRTMLHILSDDEQKHINPASNYLFR